MGLYAQGFRPPVGTVGNADLPWAMPAAVVMGDLSLVRPLASVQVVVATGDPSDVVRHSRHVRALWPLPAHGPDSHEPELTQLMALGREMSQRLGTRVPLFYGSDWQLELLYRHRQALSPFFRFQINDDQLAWILHDKASFCAHCEPLGIRVPRMLLAGGEDEATVEKLLASWKDPLLVKPKRKPYGSALQAVGFSKGCKAQAFANGPELLAHRPLLALRDRLIVQELLPSEAHDVYSFHGFCADDGRLLAWFCGHKLRSIPRFGGESALIELVKDAQLEREGREAVEKLGIKGPFKFDFIRDPRNGELVTLEVNARFSLWCDLGAAHGVNLLRVAYDYLVEGRAPAAPPDYTPRIRWVNLYRDTQALRQQNPGVLGLLRWMKPIVSGPRIYDTFAWDDPLPAVRWWQDALKRWVQP